MLRLMIFFNEINEIAPPTTPKPPKLKDSNSVWQECYDELTGYSYYWNTKTDEVTWTTPAEYKSVKDQKKEKGPQKRRTFLYLQEQPHCFQVQVLGYPRIL
ncbi:hypothetical protein NQ314_006636 [Rhamnusium bicolor]|uniref:WW domain-containing protein n=1 Tax=Rhamnusium bicolor TaxID=1586634 RepID=A0AAV8YZX2_9CUCU|nr:hypothetical protein NQ314_006636 [Rhamnusium bicolor]